MGEAARIWTTVGADILPLKAGLAEASAATDKFGATFGARMAAQTATMERFGRSWQRHVTLPILAFGAVSAKMSLDFARQMALISTSAGASAQDVKELTGEVFKLAQTSPYGPTELAKALYHLKSLGYDNVTAMKTLRAAQDGAMAGNANLEDTTSALGAAIRTNIKGTQDYEHAIATLNAIVGAGNMRMGDLIAALGTGVLPAAKAAGLSLRDVGGAIALMVDEGMSADSAATRLRMGFTLMEHGSKSANKALEEIGLNTDKLSLVMHSPAGLVGGLQLLHDHLDQLGNSQQIADWAKQVDRGKLSVAQFTKLAGQTKEFDVLAGAFGGARSSAAIMLLLNNLDVLKQKMVQIDRTTGNFKSKVQQARDLDINKLKTAWSSVEVQLIKAGAAITPFVVTMARGLASLAQWFSHLTSGSREFLLVAAGALALGGPMLIFTAKVIKALETIGVGFGSEAAASTAATGVVTADLAEQSAAVEATSGIIWTRMGGAWVAEGAAATAATSIVLTNLERQGAAAAATGVSFAALAGKIGLAAIALSLIPKNSKGQSILDAGGIGFAGHIPIIGGLATQAGVWGNDLRGLFGESSLAPSSEAYKPHHAAMPPPESVPGGYDWRTYGMGASTTDNPGGYLTWAKSKKAGAKKIIANEAYWKAQFRHVNEQNAATGDQGETEKQRRDALMKKADEQFKAQWAKLFGKSGYNPPNLPGYDGGATATGYSLPQSIQYMQAKADALAALNPSANGPTTDQIKAAQAAKAAAMAALNAHSAAWKGAEQAWGIVQQANGVLAAQAKQMNDTFVLPMRIQLEQAKADALAALDPNLGGPTSAQIMAAKQAKAAAMKAIDSHKLSMQALIQAWGIVQQANGVLAQAIAGQAHTYAAVSTRALVQGLHLSSKDAMTIRERAAQAAAHGGNKPTGPAADGIVITPHRVHHVHEHHHSHGVGSAGAVAVAAAGRSGDVIIHGDVYLGGVRSTDQLYAELQKKAARRRGQRSGQR